MQIQQWIILKMLWTFGCSHTQGHGLPDCIGENNLPLNKTSQHAWPEQLSKLLAEPVTNISHAGIGVRAVWNNILNNYNKFQENDTVIVMWPCWESRIDIIVDPDNPVNHACNIIPVRNYEENDGYYFEKYYSKYQQWLDLHVHAQHIFDLLNNKINLIYTAYDEYSEKEFNKPEWAEFELIDLYFAHTKYCDMPRALDGTHHGIEAHQAFAEDLCDTLFKRNSKGLLLYPENGM